MLTGPMAAVYPMGPIRSSTHVQFPDLRTMRQRTGKQFTVQCYACSVRENDARSFTGHIIQQIQDLPVIANHHAAIPILRPMQDDLPFAMSLEICQEFASFDPSKDVLEHPMCELLYFLDGSGSVTVRRRGGDEATLGVRAGDSVLTSGQTVVVNSESIEDAGGSGIAVTFLRVILPLQYVVDNAHSPKIAEECRSAAAKATKHWEGQPTCCPQVSAIVARIFARDEADVAGAPFMHNLQSEVLSLESITDRRAKSHNPDSALHKVSLLDAPAFQLPNQQNRLALVLDPVADDVPFTFGVEIFPPRFCTPPHVHDSAYEMFFIISGEGATAFCNGQRHPINPGNVVVFRPGSVHGIDTGDEKVYCLELLLPNQDFAEMVRKGQQLSLDQDDSCILAAIGCGAELGVTVDSILVD